ncbi:MAG: hypothetical protein E7633_10495 [Ruminococcaceae bacterium]|nr:hypothetical protein [Oscillospiraceae bacterium]
MKKFIIFILIIASLLLTFCGCTADKPKGPVFDVLIFNGGEAKEKTDVTEALGEEIIRIMDGYEWVKSCPNVSQTSNSKQMTKRYGILPTMDIFAT